MNLSLRVRLLNFFRQVWMVPFLESWLARRTAGVDPVEGLSRWVPNPYQYSSPTWRKLQRDGLVMRVDISDYIGHYLYFGFADPSANSLFSLVKPDFHVVDVGANIGWTALRMATLAGKGWVSAFEPDPQNFSRCKENVDRNLLTNLSLYPVALGSSREKVYMEVRTPSNLGGNRIAPGSAGTTSVDVWPLDEIIETFPDKRVDLMKIDVEGYELHVLRGSLSTLKRCKPLLFIELDDNNLRDQGDSAEQLVEFLEDLGYSIKDAVTNAPVQSGHSFMNCHTDIIAQ